MKYIKLVLLFFFLLFVTTTSAQDKYIPRNGEGIYAFLRRHNRTEKKHYIQFLELNKGRFGQKESLKKDVAYFLPSYPEKMSSNTPEQESSGQKTKQTGTKRKNPLFGKKYENYTVSSNRLKGACFYLACGHGGPDPGAIGKVDGKSLHEDEYAYDITLRLARRLLEEGATVYIIIQDAKDGIRDDRYLTNSNRETCMGKSIPLNQKARLKQRSDKINSLSNNTKEKYKRAVFIHLDSRSNKHQLDVFFYYAKNSMVGKRLANTMKNTFRDQYKKHQPNRGFTGTVSTRSLYVLDKTNPTGIFAELGNIQNTFDQRRFLDSANRQALAKWMCLGFIQDYEDFKKSKKK